MEPFQDTKVKAVYDGFPDGAKQIALRLRGLIFQVAVETPKVGVLQETLKWGQPSYLTPQTKSGSTLRIGVTKAGQAAIYAHCATDIISSYAAAFPGCDKIEGNRAVIFADERDLVPDRLRLLIYHGLTYHLGGKV